MSNNDTPQELTDAVADAKATFNASEQTGMDRVALIAAVCAARAAHVPQRPEDARWFRG